MAEGKANLREIFDDISLSVIKYLENHTGVTSVQFRDRQPASKRDIITWETANHPYRLPEDYKAFVLISDGLQLEWNVQYQEEALPIGRMQLNPLQAVKQATVDDCDMLVDSAGSTSPANRDGHTVAFSLDDTDGHVVLFYRSVDTPPQVWFQDLSCTWHFIANTFTDYFRLMVTHLGLPRWPYVFTATGLDPAAKQWFRFLAPERLATDLNSARRRRSEGSMEAKQAVPTVGSKLNWSQIERTSSRTSKGRRKREDSSPAARGAATGARPSTATRPGSASRARPSSAPTQANASRPMR